MLDSLAGTTLSTQKTSRVRIPVSMLGQILNQSRVDNPRSTFDRRNRDLKCVYILFLNENLEFIHLNTSTEYGVPAVAGRSSADLMQGTVSFPRFVPI